MASIGAMLAEARRRRVFRSAGLYVVGAWVLLQVAALALQSLDVPDRALRWFWLAAIAGFPLALLFSWYYELTPEGIRRTRATDSDEDLSLKLADYLLIGALAIVAGVITAGVLDRVRHGDEAVVYDPGGIAVLTLDDLSGGDSEPWFSLGMQDALITSLSKIGALRVVSRSSATSLDDTLPITAIGAALGVRNIVEGSITREGDRVRVIVQLVDAAEDAQLWAESFEREVTGVLALQNEIAAAIASAIELELSETEQAELAKRPTVDPATFDRYLRAMHHVHSESNRERRRGIGMLEELVEEGVDDALVYAGLAYGYALLGHSPFPEGMYPASKLAARRALELDERNALAWVAVGMQELYYDWDFKAAENALTRALELNPSQEGAHYHYAWLMELYKASDRALPAGEQTVRLDPLSTFMRGWLAEQYRAAGRYEDALRTADETLDLEPGHTVALMVKAMTWLELGDFDRALAASAQIAEHPLFGYTHGVVLAGAGRRDEAEAILAAHEANPRNLIALVMLSAWLDDTERVLHWLVAAREAKLPWYPWLVNWYPGMDRFRDEPRLQALAAELSLEI